MSSLEHNGPHTVGHTIDMGVGLYCLIHCCLNLQGIVVVGNRGFAHDIILTLDQLMLCRCR